MRTRTRRAGAEDSHSPFCAPVARNANHRRGRLAGISPRRRSGGQDQLAVLGDAKSVLTALVLDDQFAAGPQQLARRDARRGSAGLASGLIGGSSGRLSDTK
jgi:hypothetical protein